MDKRYLAYIYISGNTGGECYDYIFSQDKTYQELQDRVREELQGFDSAIAIVISGNEVLFEMGEVSDQDVEIALDKIDDIEETIMSNQLNY